MGGGGSEEEPVRLYEEEVDEEDVVEAILFFTRGDGRGGGGRLDILQQLCFSKTNKQARLALLLRVCNQTFDLVPFSYAFKNVMPWWETGH